MPSPTSRSSPTQRRAPALAPKNYRCCTTPFEQNGSAAGDADAAFERLGKSMVTTGSGGAADAFKQLGIGVQDAGGVRSTEVVFDDVLDKLSRVESQSQVAAIATKLFGREAGTVLTPTLKFGQAALADFETNLRWTGSLMSNEMVKRLAISTNASTGSAQPSATPSRSLPWM